MGTVFWYLGPFWGIFGAFGDVGDTLGTLGGTLGTIPENLGPNLGNLGPNLGIFRPNLGIFGGMTTIFGDILGTLFWVDTILDRGPLHLLQLQLHLPGILAQVHALKRQFGDIWGHFWTFLDILRHFLDVFGDIWGHFLGIF